MSSQRRIDANRRNAQKSTGPRTPAGKAKSALNSTQHGFAGLTLPPNLVNPLSPECFLHTENETHFRVIFAEYVHTYQPQHRDEYDLVTEAAYAKWRQHRLWLAETAQIEISIALHETQLRKDLPAADNAAQLANGIAHSENLLRLYLRYGAQLHRQYLRCLKELRDLQASRLNPQNPPPEPLPEPIPDEAPIEPIPPQPTPTPAHTTATPNEANPTPKSDAQLFEEYRDRLLRKANQPTPRS